MATENGNNVEVPPPPPNTDDLEKTYLVFPPWRWVLKKIDASASMKEVDDALALPSAKLAAEVSAAATPAQSTPATRRRRQKQKDPNSPSTLKVDFTDPTTGEFIFAVHGTSSAFEGLEDKDELVRTIQRCRCDNLVLSPPSILINWDVTHEECLNVIGKDLPALQGNSNSVKVAVLKEPMGSQGKGIFFVKNAEEIHTVIDEHRERALQEPTFLDNLIGMKGRIPSWVLQAEIVPPLLIRGRRKFHIRSYVLALEQPMTADLLELFIFNRHEVRVAGTPVPEDESGRDPSAHITNGAASVSSERLLLDEVPELTGRNMQDVIETFIASIFGKHLLSDITRRIGFSLTQDETSNVKRFALAGLDLMITDDNQIFLLEANVNPAAPREETVTPEFTDHLTGFMNDLIDLVLYGKRPAAFLSAADILQAKGLLD